MTLYQQTQGEASHDNVTDPTMAERAPNPLPKKARNKEPTPQIVETDVIIFMFDKKLKIMK